MKNNHSISLNILAKILVMISSLSANLVIADTDIISTQQILKSLLNSNQSNKLRSFKPKANPDAETKVCDPEFNQRLLEATGKRGEQLTRTLYVEEAATIDLDISFERGKANLLTSGKDQLDSLAKAMKDTRLINSNFLLAGHTDSDGSADYNNRLSCERALSVRNYLHENHDIDADSLIPMGFGFEKLKDKTNSKSEVNRRVEIRVFSGLKSNN